MGYNPDGVLPNGSMRVVEVGQLLAPGTPKLSDAELAETTSGVWTRWECPNLKDDVRRRIEALVWG